MPAVVRWSTARTSTGRAGAPSRPRCPADHRARGQGPRVADRGRAGEHEDGDHHCRPLRWQGHPPALPPRQPGGGGGQGPELRGEGGVAGIGFKLPLGFNVQASYDFGLSELEYEGREIKNKIFKIKNVTK